MTQIDAGPQSRRSGRPRLHAASRGSGVPRVTLTKPEAAAALGISVDSFERHVQPELRIIRRGRMRLIPLRELERWASDNAALTLDDEVRSRL